LSENTAWVFKQAVKKAAWVVRKSGMGFITGEQKKRHGLSGKAAWVF